jgi:uncharacterized membrane protein
MPPAARNKESFLTVGASRCESLDAMIEPHFLFLFLALLIGFLGGLRSLTPAAVIAWAVHLGRLAVPSSLAWIGTTYAVGIFTTLALAELVGDKLPQTPSRTAPPGLIARIVMGGLTGACIAAASAQGATFGALLGAIGGVAGCFGGYQARKRLVKLLGTPDFVIAVLEDLVTIGGSLWVVTRF